MNNLNDEAPSNAAHWHKVATDALAEIDRLKLQVAVADWVKRDAARYRFVRTADKVGISAEAARDPAVYDAAIDAAMQREREREDPMSGIR
jgi:hypothetical protein